MTNTDIWMISLTALIAVAGIISATIFNNQLSVMQGQLNEMKSTGKQNESLIEATKTLANAAKQSADAVGNVERPYIFVLVKPVSLAPKDGPDDPSPKISYTVTNMGRVPAIIRLFYSICKLVEGLEPQQTVDANKLRPALTAIAAGLTNSEFPICTFEKPIMAEDWADIRADRKMVVFEGIFAYEGALDYTYITSIAYKLDLFSGHAFVIGGSAYNYEQSQQGRLSQTEKMILPKVRFSSAPKPSAPANSGPPKPP